MTSHFVNTVCAGLLTFGLKRMLGNQIENVILQRLSEGKAQLAIGIFYIGFFFVVTGKIDNIERLSLNRFT